MRAALAACVVLQISCAVPSVEGLARYRRDALAAYPRDVPPPVVLQRLDFLTGHKRDEIESALGRPYPCSVLRCSEFAPGASTCLQETLPTSACSQYAFTPEIAPGVPNYGSLLEVTWSRGLCTGARWIVAM